MPTQANLQKQNDVIVRIPRRVFFLICNWMFSLFSFFLYFFSFGKYPPISLFNIFLVFRIDRKRNFVYCLPFDRMLTTNRSLEQDIYAINLSNLIYLRNYRFSVHSGIIIPPSYKLCLSNIEKCSLIRFFIYLCA